MDITVITKGWLPLLAVAVLISGMMTVGIEGLKGYFPNLSPIGVRILTFIVGAYFTYVSIIVLGDGSIKEVIVVYPLIFMGATGLYELVVSLINRKPKDDKEA